MVDFVKLEGLWEQLLTMSELELDATEPVYFDIILAILRHSKYRYLGYGRTRVEITGLK